MESSMCSLAKLICKSRVLGLIGKYNFFDVEEVRRIFGNDSALEKHVLCELCRDQLLFQKSCLAGDGDSTLYLLPYVADINEVTTIGSALVIACTHGYASIADIILRSRVSVPEPEDFDPNLGNCECCFYLSAVNGWIIILKLLISYREEIFQKTRNCINVLKFACYGGHKVVLCYCLEKFNKLVNERAILEEFVQSEILLEICLQYHQTKLVSLLIEKGAKLTKNLISKFEKSIVNYLSFGIKNKESHVVIDWRYKSLQDFSIKWIMPHYENVLELDVSFNQINILPPEVPWKLNNLKKFVIKYSSLCGLASPRETEMLCNNLEHLDLSNNELAYIPPEIFSLQGLKIINVENNHIQCFTDSDSEWKCFKLEQLVAGGNDIQDLPVQIRQCCALKKICFKWNHLKHFAGPWKCPLKTLDLSHNSIEFCSEIIDEFGNKWSKTLKEVLLSFNCISKLPNFICKLEALEVLNLSNNMLKFLPHPDDWSCKCIKTLDLSNNQLGRDKANWNHLGETDKHQHFGSSLNSKICKLSPVLPLIFSNSLTELYLCGNNLTFVPLSIACLKKLTKLDLSCNKEIEDLPIGLSELYCLEHLRIDNIDFKDTYLSQLVCKGSSTKTILAYLRQKYRKFVTFNRLQCIILGKNHIGKTSLCQSLSNDPRMSLADKFNVMEVQWDCTQSKLKQILTRSFTEIRELSVQLVEIPDIPSIDFKPLYLPGCLYLVVFDLRLHNNADEFLCSQLHDLQAQTPNAHVIIVGTFLDCLSEGRSILQNIRSLIFKKFVKAGFPKIIDIAFVSNIGDKEGIHFLKTAIISAFSKFKMGVVLDNHHSNSKLNRKFPKDYVDLSKIILKDKDMRRRHGLSPLLCENEFKEFLKDFKRSMNTKEDIDLAEQFLRDAGYMVKFPKCYGNLSNWYFIDIHWLGNTLLVEGNLKDCSDLLKDGTSSAINLEHVLNFKISSNHYIFSIEDEIELLMAFGIIYKLFDDGYLISQEIPNVCLELNIKQPNTSSKSFLRYYQMDVVPGGLFRNLLVRLIGWFQASKQGLDVNNLKSTFTRFSHFTSTSYWQKGFILETETGCLTVEVVPNSNLGCTRNLYSNGVLIYVWEVNNEEGSKELQNIFCSAVDLTNDLIDQCYPGLLYDCRMNIFAFCPFHLEEKIEPCMIDLFDCIKVILTSKSPSDLFVSCPNKHSKEVPLDYLVPDLLLCDLPLKFWIDISEIFYNTDKDVLGQGGEGIVLKGRFSGTDVAVKQNEIMISHCIQYLNGESDSNMDTEKEFLKQKMLCAFNNYRHETTMLAKLKHPCIVSLIGFSFISLTYVMELCPFGSLRSLLNSKYDEITFYDKYKICLQIIAALRYFHDQKLVYKDMKPENILVWSLSKRDTITVKLSDYGLIKRLFASGIQGIDGTSGYQAPEIWLNKSHNEKVDIFAFAMVAYELYTGDKTFLENSSLTVNAKIKQGKRPAVDADLNLIPQVRKFITRSWAHDAKERPDAKELGKMMKDLSFVMLQKIISLHEYRVIGLLSIVYPDKHDKKCIHMWSGADSGRCYHLYNESEHKFISVNFCLPGPKVTCMSQITWRFLVLGTEGLSMELIEHDIENGTVKKMTLTSTLSQPSSMITLSEEHPKRLMVGFKDGSLHMYDFRDLCLSLIYSMTLTRTFSVGILSSISSFVWASCGPEMHIIKLREDSFELESVIKMNLPAGEIITDLCHHGDQVWCACGSSGLIVEIDVETMDAICVFDCKIASHDHVISSFGCVKGFSKKTFKKTYRKPLDEGSISQVSKSITPLYLSSRQKRSIKRNSNSKQVLRGTLSSAIKSVMCINGILWAVLKNCNVVLINVTRENMFNYEYGHVLNVMTSNEVGEVKATHVVRVETEGTVKVIIAKTREDRKLPYNAVQLISWMALDLATTHSYLKVHKELQAAIASTLGEYS